MQELRRKKEQEASKPDGGIVGSVFACSMFFWILYSFCSCARAAPQEQEMAWRMAELERRRREEEAQRTERQARC